MSDDAYISFRTADNLLNRYRPVSNVGEQVPSSTTHCGWRFCTAAFSITGNIYYTAIALSIFVTLGFFFILISRVAISSRHWLVCFAVLLSSKAFIDFSTSGLEDPLTHVLLLAFLLSWWSRREDARRLAVLSLLAALCMLQPPRPGPDSRATARVVVPAAGRYPLGAGLVSSLFPIVLWLVFATFYYGTPFPNTAYAKLSTGLTIDVRLARGVDYFLRTLLFDPVTLPAIALGLVGLVWTQRRADWSIAAGLLLYFVYILLFCVYRA